MQYPTHDGIAFAPVVASLSGYEALFFFHRPLARPPRPCDSILCTALLLSGGFMIAGRLAASTDSPAFEMEIVDLHQPLTSDLRYPTRSG